MDARTWGGGMGKYTIAVIPGDGVGKEVVDEGIRLMETLGIQVPDLAFAFVRFDWGSEYYFRHGRMMPEDALDTLTTKHGYIRESARDLVGALASLRYR